MVIPVLHGATARLAVMVYILSNFVLLLSSRRENVPESAVGKSNVGKSHIVLHSKYSKLSNAMVCRRGGMVPISLPLSIYLCIFFEYVYLYINVNITIERDKYFLDIRYHKSNIIVNVVSRLL